MKLFGHPLHIMLVHFPAALLPIEFVAYALYFVYGDVAFATTSLHTMAAGVVLGWIAAILGLIDFIKLSSSNRSTVNPSLLHGGLNVVVMMVYTVILFKAIQIYPLAQVSSFGLLLVRALANAVMIVGNYVGGDLILKHRIALKN